MHSYTAHVLWNRGDQVFLDSLYSRRYLITFDGGVTIPGSPSPHVVRVPLSDPAAVDPEEAFVASLSGCHMLWFLSLAAERGFRVDSYSDNPEGIIERNGQRKLAMSLVTLRPMVIFSGKAIPTQEEFAAMHEEAHGECFIANSVKTEIRCEPVLQVAA